MRYASIMVPQKTIEKELQNLIRKLPTAGVDKCTTFFTEDALGRGTAAKLDSVSEIEIIHSAATSLLNIILLKCYLRWRADFIHTTLVLALLGRSVYMYFCTEI